MVVRCAVVIGVGRWAARGSVVSGKFASVVLVVVSVVLVVIGM
jgi:hypothetical protein